METARDGEKGGRKRCMRRRKGRDRSGVGGGEEREILIQKIIEVSKIRKKIRNYRK